MLVLHSTSRCDVCLLEYNWETSAKVPHAIACGHIFCRDCLYATTPPLCPLCRKQYQPTKIKKLHVDRPENVDEVREAELGRQQLELLEQLVEVWDLELREGLVSDFDDEGNREHSIVNRSHHEDGDDREGRSESEEEMHDAVSADPHLALPSIEESDEQIGGLLLRGEGNPSRLDRGNDVEQILDGIAGAPGVGRGFLERWGSMLATQAQEGGAIVTVREAQKFHATEVLRRVDVWLEGKDEDSAVALRRSRLFFAQHLALRVALKDALEFAKSLNEERSSMLRDLQELENIKHLLQAAGEELQNYNALVEAISVENRNLKASLSKRPRNPSPPLRNPLPRPPEPVSTEHLPTFAQAVSEGSGSAHNGSVYSPPGSSTGVRFATASTPPGRARERYLTGTEDGPSPPSGRSSRSGKKRGQGRDNSHYSYRDDSGYFEDEDRWQQSASSGSAHPISAPPVVQGFTSSQRSSNDHGAYSAGHEHSRHKHSSRHHVSRSGSQTQYEGSSQPLDVFSATSHYLREYSAGFVNGQAAALGVGPFATPPPQMMAPAAARASSRAANNPGSIIYTSDSMEDVAGQESELLQSYSASSPSRSGNLPLPSNYLLASMASSPPRGQLSFVSLPSVSSHGQLSPSLSSNRRPPYSSSHSSSNLLTREDGSPRHSVASSGLNPPPSLPHDPEAAAAMIAAQYAIPGRASPSNRSQRTSVSSGWGTIYSNTRSNSLISGLRGLPVGQGDAYDSASVRTRATRFSMDLVDIGDRDSVRDSRRESHASVGARSNMSEIEEEAREGSPVRPVHSMVGVLPLDEPGAHSQQAEGEFSRSSASTNRMGSNVNTSPYSQRSSTAVDRHGASDATMWNTGYNATHSTQSRTQTGNYHQSRQPEPQPGIAASIDWISTQNPNSGSGTTAGYYPEYERQGTSRSPHHSQGRASSRSPERRSNRDDDGDRHRRPTTAYRSQTAMGVSSAHSASGSSSWSFHDTSNYRSARAHNRSHEPISPTSHPSVIQSSSSASINPTHPLRLARERDRDRDADRERSSRSRAHQHGHSHSSNTRPSLLSREPSSAFPVSVETTDEERYPRISTARSRTAMNTNNDGRSTRIGRHGNSSSATVSSISASGVVTTVENSSSLQSFGTQNALGLELVTTANGISAPAPVSRSSTQGFLRSFSHGDPA